MWVNTFVYCVIKKFIIIYNTVRHLVLFVSRTILELLFFMPLVAVFFFGSTQEGVVCHAIHFSC